MNTVGLLTFVAAIGAAACHTESCPLESIGGVPALAVTFTGDDVPLVATVGTAEARTTSGQATRFRLSLGFAPDASIDAVLFDVPSVTVPGIPVTLPVGADSIARVRVDGAIAGEPAVTGTLALTTLDIACVEASSPAPCSTLLEGSVDLAFDHDGTAYRLTGAVSVEDVLIEVCH